jgi:hypothetical protein
MKRDNGTLAALGVAGLLAAASALARRGAGGRNRKVAPVRSQPGSTWADQESARRHMQMLLKVMDPDDRGMALQYASISDGWLRDWLLDYGDRYDRGGAYDVQELIEAIDMGDVERAVAGLTDDAIPYFNDWAASKANDWGEMPPAQVFTGPELLRDIWLIHHSSAGDIDTRGFRFGVQEIEGLAYTGSGHTYEGQDPGYNFAYHPDDHDTYGWATRGSGRLKYGQHAYAFWVPWAVRATHHGDQEPQVIFWGPSARNIVPISREVWNPEADGWGGEKGAEEDRWVIEGLDGDRPGRTVSAEDAGDLVSWLEENYDQYRRVLGQALDRRRRRVERGWKRQQVGERQVKSRWSKHTHKEPVYADLYKGPRKGGPNRKQERPLQVLSTRAHRVGFKASAVAHSMRRGLHHDPRAIEYVEVTLAGTPDQLRSRKALELANQVGSRDLPGPTHARVASGIHQNRRGQMVCRFEVS